MKIDENKILFVNVAPMRLYRGYENFDKSKGGSFVRQYGFCHTMYNFYVAEDGNCYGTTPTGYKLSSIINSDAIHEDGHGNFVDNVLVVFTSTAHKGTYITAFYVGAQLYDKDIKDESLSMRYFDNSSLNDDSIDHYAGLIAYRMKCKAENAYVIPPQRRNMLVPRAKSKSEPGMGQSPQWYAKGEKNARFRKSAIAYVEQLLREANDKGDREFQNEVDILIREKNIAYGKSDTEKLFSNLPTKPQEEKEANSGRSIKYKRNPAKAQYVIEKQAKHLCQVNAEHPTFKRKDGVHNYVEAHHLIPTKNQNLFLHIDLDNPANIVALCSNCHNCIHYGYTSEAEELITQLYELKKEALKEATLFINLDQLFDLQ